MKDILEDIETRIYALDKGLPGNSAARDLLKILDRARTEIMQLRIVIKMARDNPPSSVCEADK